MEKIKDYFEKSFGIVYGGLFYISLIAIIMVIGFIFGVINSQYNVNNEIVIKMLPPLGITLSALLASTSVMKSIQNTNKIEERKKEKEKKQFKNKLKIYMNEVKYFIDFYKTMSINFDKFTQTEIKESLIMNQKNLTHSKNLIIKDINFIEHIGNNEYEIISLLNFIETNIDLEIRINYNKELHETTIKHVNILEETLNKLKISN
jgi:hypothetical protein